MLDLQELKSKYPLALDTIKLPVEYLAGFKSIFDAHNKIIIDVADYDNYKHLPNANETQDQIGELIAELLNQLQ